MKNLIARINRSEEILNTKQIELDASNIDEKSIIQGYINMVKDDILNFKQTLSSSIDCIETKNNFTIEAESIEQKIQRIII